MSKETPQYKKGDKVVIPHEKKEGQVSDRMYSDPVTKEGGQWIYTIQTNSGDIKLYREKDLDQ